MTEDIHVNGDFTAARQERGPRAVVYINAGFKLYFLSSPKLRHGRDIAVNPKVAGTV